MSGSIIELWLWFTSQDLRFKVVFLLSSTLLLVSIFLFILVLRMRNRRSSADKKASLLLEELEPTILDLVYSEEAGTWEESLASMRNMLNINMYEFHSYARISDYLVKLHKQLEGEAATKVERIYKDLLLPERTLELLKKGAWHQKVKALSALAEFKVKRYLFEVIQFMGHRRRLVRDEAQFTAIVLGGKKAVISIGDLSYHISKWQQLRLIEECVKIGDTIKEEVFSWLSSSNETLIELGLRMCNRMGWHEVRVSIPQLIGHRREEIRILSIRAVMSVGTPELLSDLIHRFEVESRRVQLVIIDAIEELDFEHRMKDFLISQIFFADIELALRAAHAYVSMVEYEEWTKLQNELPEGRQQILQHVAHA